MLPKHISSRFIDTLTLGSLRALNILVILALVLPNVVSPARASAQPLVVDAKRLSKLLCCGVRTVRTWDAAGKLPTPLRIGGRVVWIVDDVRAWLAAGAPNRDQWEARKSLSRK